MRIALALAALLTFTQEAPVPRTARIEGRVVDADTGRPIGRAIVWAENHLRKTVNRPNPQDGSAETMADGTFVLDRLEPGDYTIQVQFFLRSYTIPAKAGRADPALSQISERNAQLIDTSGRSFMRASGPLVPGEPSGWSLTRVYTPTYFGGLTEARATHVVLDASTVHRNVDISIKAEPAVRVSGTAVDATGRPVPGAFVTLQREARRAADMSPFFREIPPSTVASAVADAAGEFLFLAAPGGDYLACAIRPNPPMDGVLIEPNGVIGILQRDWTAIDPDRWYGSTPVSIRAEGTGPVKIVLSPPPAPTATATPGVRISGTFTSNIPPLKDRVVNVAVFLFGPNGQSLADVSMTGGHFAFNGIQPGRYELAPPRIIGYDTTSLLINGREVADNLIDIGTDPIGPVTLTIAKTINNVSGSVTLLDGSAANPWVVLFPTNETFWPFKGTLRIAYQRAKAGHYEFDEVPQGDYFLAAVDDQTMDDWPDPKALKTISLRSIRVGVTNGAKVMRDLIFTPPRGGTPPKMTVAPRTFRRR
jgi:hypothetical protein